MEAATSPNVFLALILYNPASLSMTSSSSRTTIKVPVCVPIDLITVRSFSLIFSSNKEFITCFSRILNLRFFFHKILCSIFRGLQCVLFCYDKQLYIGIFYLNRKILPCRKTKQIKFCEKKIVDSGIVKTCDELDHKCAI